MMFRDLKADEIECRIAMVKDTGVQLLLYKDARCDQTILDETVGEMNWQRHHSRENANCIVSIWDEKKGQWIEKEDTGTESNTEAEKGLASDSFKRSCTNWGIGRELYTAPFIWISKDDCNIEKGKTLKCKDKFDVSYIKIENKKIVELSISNLTTHKKCFTFPKSREFVKEPAIVKTVNKEPEKKVETVNNEPEYKCEVCGKVFTEAKDKKGNIRTAKEVYEAWKKASPDGVCRCGACKKKYEAMQQAVE